MTGRSSIKTLFALLAFACATHSAAGVSFADNDKTVNIYSARKEALILPILERFRDETGIEFKLVTGKADALLKRLRTEGEATPADIFVTVDAGRLHRAREAGVLQRIGSGSVDDAVPAHLRDADGFWVALSKRARTVMYARDRVDPAALSTYEGLADPMWEGRICIRSSGNIYNQSLVSSMIEANGAGSTEAWARELVANFARPPAGGDTDQLRAAAAGECDLAVANTYYLGRLAASGKEADRVVAAALGVFWPNQGDGRPRRARQRERNRHHGACAEPGERGPPDRVPGLARGAELVRECQSRVSGRARRPGVGNACIVRLLHGRLT